MGVEAEWGWISSLGGGMGGWVSSLGGEMARSAVWEGDVFSLLWKWLEGGNPVEDEIFAE